MAGQRPKPPSRRPRPSLRHPPGGAGAGAGTRARAHRRARTCTPPRAPGAGGAGAAGRAEVWRARQQHGGRALVAAVRALAACGSWARSGARAAPPLGSRRRCPGPAGLRAAAPRRLQRRPALAPAQPRRSAGGRRTGRRRRGRRRRRRRRGGGRRGRAGHNGVDAAARPGAFPQRPAHRCDAEPRLPALHQDHRGELPPSPRFGSRGSAPPARSGPACAWVAAAARCRGRGREGLWAGSQSCRRRLSPALLPRAGVPGWHPPRPCGGHRLTPPLAVPHLWASLFALAGSLNCRARQPPPWPTRAAAARPSARAL